MKPGSQYAEQDATDAPTTWSPPPAAPDTGYVPPTAPRARIGLIVLTALIVEILLIGGGANQWVTDKILRNPSDTLRGRLIENSWLTFNWRFSPRTGLTSTWAAHMSLVACVLVFSAAFIWCLLRGPVTWGRAFIGSWLAVLGATVLGAIARGFIDPLGKYSLPGADRVTRALFSGSGLSSVVIVGGIALGFVVAVITSIVAVVSRRPALPGYGGNPGPGSPAFANPAYANPAFANPNVPDPTFPDYAAPARTEPGEMRPWQEAHYRPPAAAAVDQPTTQLPAVSPRGAGQDAADSAESGGSERSAGAGRPAGSSDSADSADSADSDAVDQPTTQLPVAAPPPREPAAPSDESATTRFPRPPDDEELGHFGH